VQLSLSRSEEAAACCTLAGGGPGAPIWVLCLGRLSTYLWKRGISPLGCAMHRAFLMHPLPGPWAARLRSDGMLYKLRDDLAPGRDDEIIALSHVWDTVFGPTPPELVALDVAFHFVKALAGAISLHPEGAVFGPLFPPSCLQLACYSGSGARYLPGMAQHLLRRFEFPQSTLCRCSKG
jgi:hypothetical protein